MRVLAWLLSCVALLWLSPSAVRAGAPDPLADVVTLLADGRSAEALALVESFDDAVQQAPRVIYLRARLRDAHGQRAEALPLLHQLKENPQGLPPAIAADVDKRIAEWTAALSPRATPVSRSAPPKTSHEKLERAERLLNAGREQSALDLLRGTPPRSLRGRWYHVRGMAFFRMRNHYGEAARELSLAAAAGGDTQAFDAFHAARALARNDQDNRAIVELRKFARRFPSSSYAAEAMYLAGWLELRLGRMVGLTNLQRFVDSPLASNAPAIKQEAQWTLGYYAYTHGKLKDAERALTDAASAGRDQMSQNAASYWAARAKHDSGDRDGAITVWKAIIERDPFHWYALLSRARLAAIGVELPALTAAASDAVTQVALSPQLPDDVAFYAGIGLFADASHALQAQETTLRARWPAEHALPTLVRAYHAVNDYARPYHLTIAAHADALMTAWSPATDWIWRTTMATPYRTLAAREAQAHGVELTFVYSIMRKESAFDPSVVSYADALGLMQLLHGTAVKVARALGDPEPSRTQVFEPATNIRLGTALLAQLRRELGDEPAFAMAGYNAGAHRVHQWRKRASAPELDRFVEEIPIDQTRNYVRRVYANWARYRYLLEPNREPLRLTLALSP